MITKKVYIFTGSLSVLQILEGNGIEDALKGGMSRDGALMKAKETIAAHFERTGQSWDYTLDLYVQEISARSRMLAALRAQRVIDEFEEENEEDFEESDGSGDAQGFTAFIF